MGSLTSKPQQQHDDSNTITDIEEDICDCYEIDEPTDCLEEADIVDDYIIDQTPYIEKIESLLQKRSEIERVQQEIDTFDFQKDIVDATRLKYGTYKYCKLYLFDHHPAA